MCPISVTRKIPYIGVITSIYLQISQSTYRFKFNLVSSATAAFIVVHFNKNKIHLHTTTLKKVYSITSAISNHINIRAILLRLIQIELHARKAAAMDQLALHVGCVCDANQ